LPHRYEFVREHFAASDILLALALFAVAALKEILTGGTSTSQEHSLDVHRDQAELLNLLTP
jgi:hypothetical protein